MRRFHLLLVSVTVATALALLNGASSKAEAAAEAAGPVDACRLIKLAEANRILGGRFSLQRETISQCALISVPASARTILIPIGANRDPGGRNFRRSRAGSASGTRQQGSCALTTTVQTPLRVFGRDPAFQVEWVHSDACDIYPPQPPGTSHELVVSHHGRLFGLSSDDDFGKRKIASFSQLIALARLALRRF